MHLMKWNSMVGAPRGIFFWYMHLDMQPLLTIDFNAFNHFVKNRRKTYHKEHETNQLALLLMGLSHSFIGHYHTKTILKIKLAFCVLVSPLHFWTQDINITSIKRSEDAQCISWTSNAREQLAGGRGKFSPAFYWKFKKVPWFWGINVLILLLEGLNFSFQISHFKYCFRNI